MIRNVKKFTNIHKWIHENKNFGSNMARENTKGNVRNGPYNDELNYNW